MGVIFKRCRDLRNHRTKRDTVGAHCQTMAQRGYFRDILGVRTEPWTTKDATNLPAQIKDLDETAQRFVVISSVVGDKKGMDPEWPKFAAVAEAIHEYPGSFGQIRRRM